jgi:hypothetical protein
MRLGRDEVSLLDFAGSRHVHVDTHRVAPPIVDPILRHLDCKWQHSARREPNMLEALLPNHSRRGVGSRNIFHLHDYLGGLTRLY